MRVGCRWTWLLLTSSHYCPSLNLCCALCSPILSAVELAEKDWFSSVSLFHCSIPSWRLFFYKQELGEGSSNNDHFSCTSAGLNLPFIWIIEFVCAFDPWLHPSQDLRVPILYRFTLLYKESRYCFAHESTSNKTTLCLFVLSFSCPQHLGFNWPLHLAL